MIPSSSSFSSSSSFPLAERNPAQHDPRLSSSLLSGLNSPSPTEKGKARADAALPPDTQVEAGLFYRPFRSEEEDLPGLMRLVEDELSEPYNVYTYRYFLTEWPHLTFLVFPSPSSSTPIATIICKQDSHRGRTNRGYIAMLSVDKGWRRRGIASTLVRMAARVMAEMGGDEVVLETESDNQSSLALYERLGFLREKRLHRFYSNGKDAFRLILPLPSSPSPPFETPEEADNGRWMVGAGGGEELDAMYTEAGLETIAEEGKAPRPIEGVRAGTPRPSGGAGRGEDIGGGIRRGPPLPPRPGTEDWYT